MLYVWMPLHMGWLLVNGLCVLLYLRSPKGGCCSISGDLSYSIDKEDYLQKFKCVSFWLLNFCVWLEGLDSAYRFNHTSWMRVVTPTDRPKSVRISYVIEVLWLLCVVSWLSFPDGVGSFVIALSQISSFLLIYTCKSNLQNSNNEERWMKCKFYFSHFFHISQLVMILIYAVLRHRYRPTVHSSCFSLVRFNTSTMYFPVINASRLKK